MENSSLSIFESNEKILFKLTKAAFHNSCGSNFVTLDFYENTHLSGTNGVGKSSKLNAIQIGYLPHNNFKGVEKNFYFVSKGKPYVASKVYEYHFPDLNSYIIYEFQNPHGTFCQIIYRGKEELSIERAFVPLTLDEIYDWFWIFEKDDELGKPTHLGYQQLIEKITQIIQALKQQGRSILIIEHHMNFVRKVSDTVLFLDDKKITLEGTPDEVLENSMVKENYLG